MKKLLSVVLVMLLAVGMTGCGSSSNGKTELLIGYLQTIHHMNLTTIRKKWLDSILI